MMMSESGQFFGVCISKRSYGSAPRKMAEKSLSWIYGSFKKDVRMKDQLTRQRKHEIHKERLDVCY